MSNTNPIDKSKKSNIKCENCGNYLTIFARPICVLTGDAKSWCDRCKKFVWDETKKYKEGT